MPIFKSNLYIISLPGWLESIFTKVQQISISEDVQKWCDATLFEAQQVQKLRPKAAAYLQDWLYIRADSTMHRPSGYFKFKQEIYEYNTKHIKQIGKLKYKKENKAMVRRYVETSKKNMMCCCCMMSMMDTAC